MTTQISSKLAALAVALMMNSLLIGGVALVFNNAQHLNAPLMSLTAGSAASQRSV
jgi:hypothetical protein